MKIHRILILFSAIALSQGALAETVSAETLGATQGTIDFCAKINPGAAAQYRKQAALEVKDVPAADLKKARAADAYRKAYADTSARLAQVAAPQALAACTGLLEEPAAAAY